MPTEDLIRLVRADNPSPLTGAGTNSYLLGRGDVVVIDPGPDLDSHFAALFEALGPGERITTILVTHAHLDHSALVPRLKAATGAEVLAFGPADSGRSAIMTALAGQGLTGSEGADAVFQPDLRLNDGDVVSIAGLEIETLHLPGHMGCHVGFAVGDILFSGDHVMQWSSTLVSPPDGDMTAYMATLGALARRKWSRFLPGHGPEVTDPVTRMAELTEHRLLRERAILQALQGVDGATAAELAKLIYTATPPHLMYAASRNVLAHLIDMSCRNLVHVSQGALATASFHAR
jgi:glyoxylase-like metal-dependent hydrolase (beta-lactamase superfamily II)